MFNLLGLSIGRKCEKLQNKYEDKVNRMMTKLPPKERNKLRKQQIDDAKAAQEKHELEMGGGFEKIFPLYTEATKNAFENAIHDPNLNPQQKQVYQQQYHASVSTQERYDEFLFTIQTNENEKAARQQIKIEENKKKDAIKNQAENEKLKEKKRKEKIKREQYL